MNNEILDNEVLIYLPFKPTSASRPIMNKETGGVGYSKAYRNFINLVKDWAKENEEFLDSSTINLMSFNTFSIEIVANFQIQNEFLWGIEHTVKPDGDNILKAVKDQIAVLLGFDDMKFYKSTIEKRYAQKDSIYIKITGKYNDYESLKKMKRPVVRNKKKSIITKKRPTFEISKADRERLKQYDD